jgi:glycosyltransferase involved in cell wall biosynthesis
VTKRLRVCIDARLEPGSAGGVVQGVLGLAHGLSRLDDGDEEYKLLVRPGRGEWLQPYVGDRLGLVEAIRPDAPPPRARLRTRLAARLVPADDAGEELVPPSKGVAEAMGADVVHLPTQQGFRTAIPSLYHPWDLQHVHYPEFFDADDRRARDLIYRALCRQARVVVMPTRWGAEDVIANLGVPRRKVAVIPAASPLTAYAEPTAADLARVRAALDLPEAFVLYPAQTWPHKNHMALVKATAELAGQGILIPVICAGWQNDFYATIDREVRSAGLSELIRFPGHLAGPDVAAVSKLALALVFPSLFEGWGFPILEAFSSGLPVVCSDIPPLREVARTAALMFDPNRPDDIAGALRRVWEDDAFRRELEERGRRRMSEFSWERSARLTRAHYRKLGGIRLSDDDKADLEETGA